ncbi:MAG TPA: hypothetical protein VF796_22665 [Humisphaera sp.]
MLLPNELARREANGGVFVRPDPVRLAWTFDDLPAADGHALRVRYACGVRPVNDPTEIRMLQDVLMSGRPSLRGEDVQRYLSATLRSAAVAAAAGKGIEAWLNDPAARDTLAAALKTAADRAAFSCGLEVLAPAQVELESPSFEQKRLADLQRKLSEQEAAGRVEHFNRATELLRQFEGIREKAPDLTPGTILGRLSPVDQGATLQTLLLASAKNAQAADLWAVGGEYLIKVDARNGGTPRTELFPMPPTLGPLRSVQSAQADGERVLLVGARGGFYLVRPAEAADPEVYPDLGVESQLGFSRVVFQSRDRGFAACHGDAGLVRWAYKHNHGPSGVLRPERFGARPQVGMPPPAPVFSVSAGGSIQGSIQQANRVPGPRNLQVLDDRRLLLSVGPRLWVVDGDAVTTVDYAASAAGVASIVLDGRLVQVVHEDGTIATLDAPTLRTVATRQRPMRVRAVGALPWLGSTRLLLAGDDGPVQCVGTEDSLVSEYASAHRGLRVLAASADLVAGVSADRQRLVLWHAWDGRRPAAEVAVSAQIRHRIADVEFC